MNANTEFSLNVYNTHWTRVHKISPSGIHKSITCWHANSKTSMKTIAECSQAQIFAFYWHFFTPFTMCTRKGPRAAQNHYSEPLYDFQGKQNKKAFTTPQKNDFFSSSVSLFLALPIICSTKARHSFWMISAAKEMGNGGRGEGKGGWEGAGEERS